MKSYRSWLLLPAALWLAGCELPFLTKPTDDQQAFKVYHDYDGRRITAATPVIVSWSEVTIENFKEFLVERARIDDQGIHWSIIARVPDSLAVSYTDTLDDDVTFQYRVRAVNTRNQYRHATSAKLPVPRVAVVLVPDDYPSLQAAFDNDFIDPGDSILVRPGEYAGFNVFEDKDVLIRSLEGWPVTILDGSGFPVPVVSLNRGRLQGFTIRGGTAYFAGGGVRAAGSALVRDCVIRANRSLMSPDAKGYVFPMALGGGVFAADSARIENCRIEANRAEYGGAGLTATGAATVINCRIENNQARRYGGGVLLSGHTGLFANNRIFRNRVDFGGPGAGIYLEDGAYELWNCVLAWNNGLWREGGLYLDASASAVCLNCVFYDNFQPLFSGLADYGGGLSLVNCILWGSRPIDIDRRAATRACAYSDIKGLSPVLVNHNLDAEPRFRDPDNGDFRLLPGSPCIDAGHPAEAYRDRDGTRNDLGITGGPFGE